MGREAIGPSVKDTGVILLNGRDVPIQLLSKWLCFCT